MYERVLTFSASGILCRFYYFSVFFIIIYI